MQAAPASVIVNALLPVIEGPATVMDPARLFPFELASAEKLTEPLPVPDAEPARCSQEAVAEAAHAQSDPESPSVIVDPEVPVDPKAMEEGLRLTTQPLPP